jgi:LysM repeat protein
MSESEQNAADVIESYRKRRERTVPVILGGLAVVLVVVGVFLIVIWLTGGDTPALPAFMASPTPTETPTDTPLPPTATATITPTYTSSPTPTEVWPKEYIIELGDSLWSVAEEFGVTIELLVAYNDIEDPNNVPIGTLLTIPKPESDLPTETPLPEDLQPGDQIEYMVKPGDNLAVIAERFGTTVEAIVEENDIEDQNNIGIGTLLIITVGRTPTPTTPTITPEPGTPTATPES